MLTGQDLSNGEKIRIIHNLEFEGTPKSFKTYFEKWFHSPFTTQWTERSLISYVKRKNPNCIFLSEADYNRITEGKKVSATKEEYDAQEAAKR